MWKWIFAMFVYHPPSWWFLMAFIRPTSWSEQTKNWFNTAQTNCCVLWEGSRNSHSMPLGCDDLVSKFGETQLKGKSRYPDANTSIHQGGKRIRARLYGRHGSKCSLSLDSELQFSESAYIFQVIFSHTLCSYSSKKLIYFAVAPISVLCRKIFGKMCVISLFCFALWLRFAKKNYKSF